MVQNVKTTLEFTKSLHIAFVISFYKNHKFRNGFKSINLLLAIIVFSICKINVGIKIFLMSSPVFPIAQSPKIRKEEAYHGNSGTANSSICIHTMETARQQIVASEYILCQRWGSKQ